MKQIEIFFRTILLAVLLLFYTSPAILFAQDKSMMDNVEFGLVTCSPHEEVYSLYGHTAIRYRELITGRDLMFNYGVFNFNTPYFVPRFVFGKTDYELGVTSTKAFCKYYQRWGSQVSEQVLNLTAEEKSRLMHALSENLRPENRIYRYNFFYDNCSTRPRDAIENCLVGNPYPEFSADKMKVGILFRKPGLVNIPELGRVYSFTYSNRTIIRNGKNYIRTLGVGVSAEKEAELLAYFGKCGGELHISKLDDVEVIKAVEAINGNTGLKYYKLDLSKIKVLSNKTAEEAEKSVAEIGDTVQTIQWHKGRVKAIKAAFKSLSPAAYTSGKKIASMFAHYNAEALQILTDNGIDIYSGAYVAKDDLSKDDIKEGTDSKDAPISIKYEVTGFHFNNLTGDDLVQGNAKAMKNELYKQQLEKYGRVGDFVLNHPQEALEAIDESDKIVRANTRIVWMHNAAMLQKTKFTSIYKGNTDWVEVPSRAKNAKKYAYNGLPLTMLVQGVTVG